MAKYLVDKAFRAADTKKDDEVVESELRKKGSIVELSGAELKFGLENKCLTKLKD